ncbi:3-methyladenine DNA glycosylase [Frondihabitans sp. PAMC 28766]|uniref:DNA-3-methyladenine glycosylase n=1 Tax=Frondihabitans sp. PAMC 28766 TaxID=1795630 RepID=UPI00078D8A18|nr:DNA-3-methyladenine glycosylase [Frondihabitans sp. PAMC 28766]AMM20577.1 3-methyladenine DNA glycosylase [Frondihabitans sp. PAMC 28766]
MIDPLARPAPEAAPSLLGAVFRAGPVAIRLTEVEAYAGEGQDPGSHAHRGPTPRTRSMWGPPGTLYVYLSYGIHRCVNIVCGPVGSPSGVLLRAGEVVDGLEVARSRRPASRGDVDLARGPGRLGTVLGVSLGDDGSSVSTPPFSLLFPTRPSDRILTGPRVGVSGHAGTDAYSWRFFLDDPTVSPYRPATVRRRPR